MESGSDRDIEWQSGTVASLEEFVTDTWKSYQKNQTDANRANSDPRQFITTNMMGSFDGYDQYVVSEDLDLAAWDDYVSKAKHLDPVDDGVWHDVTRGLKNKNFWVMETQPESSQQLPR
jgi:beta-galactosidase